MYLPEAGNAKPQGRNPVPAGTVTLLFTDIQGSTRLWEAHPEHMRVALARHDALLRRAIEENEGHVFKTVGDAFCAAFATPRSALEAALAAQRALLAEPWPPETPLRVRMALHTGAVESRDGDYFGPPLNRVNRLLATGHGGQSLLSLATQELVRDGLPAGVSLRDLGPHRLKDLARPEQVYQLRHAALPDAFPALRSLSTQPNNLPQQLTSFIGRERETAAVQSLLQSHRLVTLTGAGGTGKTRLALQAAANTLERYPGGVWLAELAALTDPALVPQTVAAALGLREESGKPVTRSLIEYLSERQVLLVLDNCEHLLDACAALADTLLRQCPGVVILASGREALGIGGENTYRVPSLSLPDPGKRQTPESLAPFESVHLFIDRAVQAKGEFALTSANAPALASLCHRLDGIPLALELAAARVRSLSVEEINGRLDQRFRLLTGGSRTALPRQQTLRSLIDWSYDLLTAAEKTLLCRLSVFAGGWTLPAAEAVCAGDPIEDWELLDLLTSLCDKSLAVAEPSGTVTRYRLLETIRQYARDRLGESGEGDAFRDRHLAHFLALAEEAEPMLKGAEQVLYLERLERESDNFRAALEWSGAPPSPGDAASGDAASGDAASGVRLAGAICWFWQVRGYLSEGRERVTRALARDAGGAPPLARAKALNGAGNLAWAQGDYAAARALHEESLALQREQGDRRGTANSLNNLGAVAWNQGDYASARALHEESLRMRRELDDRAGIANSLNNLGLVALDQGDDASARAFFDESLAIRRERGDRGGIATSLNNLGLVARREGDYAAARGLYEESLAGYRELGDRRGIAFAWGNLGIVTYEQGDYASARPFFEESLAIQREVGDEGGVAHSLNNLASVAYQQGDYPSSRALYGQSLVVYRRIDDRPGMLAAFDGLAALSAVTGFAPAASRLWGAQERLREEIGSPRPANERARHEDQVAAARAALADDAAFDAAWAEGRALPLEQAIALALDQAPPHG